VEFHVQVLPEMKKTDIYKVDLSQNAASGDILFARSEGASTATQWQLCLGGNLKYVAWEPETVNKKGLQVTKIHPLKTGDRGFEGASGML
jgi:hypothetical protein